MEKLSSKKRTRTPHSPHKGRGTVPPKERGGANEKQKLIQDNKLWTYCASVEMFTSRKIT